MKTTGCGNQRGSPTARSNRNALIRSAAGEPQKTCEFIKTTSTGERLMLVLF